MLRGVSFVLFGLMLLAYSRQVRAQSAAQGETAVADHASFSDAADKVGLAFRDRAYHTSTKYLLETMGSGVAVFDYDNDGLLDVFFANGAPIPNPAPKGFIPHKTSSADWDRLFHQRKDGTFEDVTEKSGLKGFGYSLGTAVGDYDNDGFDDLYVTAYGGNHLYHNNGDGTFTDVTLKSGTGGDGLPPDEQWFTSAAWVDLDNDGRLDLVVLRYVKWSFDETWCGEHREGYRSYCHPDIYPAIRALVYRNNGDGTFTEKAAAFGLDKPGKGLGIALADYDQDGKVDLAVANDSMPEFLYRNKGGSFEETGLAAEIAVDSDGRTYAGMGIDFQDYNNDGLPDLVITNLANQKYALYRNNGDGSFTYDTYSTGLAAMTLLHSGWGVHFFDYDNDGLKDLLIAQGHDLDTIALNFPQLHYQEPMLLVRNLGQGRFANVSGAAGVVFQQPWVGRGLALGDMDNDGNVDAVVTTNNGPAHYLHNETQTGNHWLTLLLVGHRSNRDGIGAEVTVTTAAGAQLATVSTAGSYLSSGDKRVHFGLGPNATNADVTVRWPSGTVQQLKNVRADQQVHVDEPAH